MDKEREKKGYMRKKMPLWLSVFLMRWWAVGMVYFAIGWGTAMGRYSSIIDLVVFLGLIIGVVHSFVLNPIFKQLFNYGWYKPYGKSTFIQRFYLRLLDIFLALCTVFLVMRIYQLVNTGAVKFLDYDPDMVFLPGEPILFGLFYALINLFFMSLIARIKKKKRS